LQCWNAGFEFSGDCPGLEFDQSFLSRDLDKEEPQELKIKVRFAFSDELGSRWLPLPSKSTAVIVLSWRL
jgi:hypothetical protein